MPRNAGFVAARIAPPRSPQRPRLATAGRWQVARHRARCDALQGDRRHHPHPRHLHQLRQTPTLLCEASTAIPYTTAEAVYRTPRCIRPRTSCPTSAVAQPSTEPQRRAPAGIPASQTICARACHSRRAGLCRNLRFRAARRRRMLARRHPPPALVVSRFPLLNQPRGKD